MDDLTGEFIAETRETLAAIGDALIAWEADATDTARLAEIFRFVHTVKGSCGFLNLSRIEALAHAAETVLADLRSGVRIANPALVSVMLRIIDRIAILVDAMDSDAEFPPIVGDHALIAAIETQAMPDPVTETGAGSERPKVHARNIRVSVDLLDGLMNEVSDLVLVRNELARGLRTVRGDSPAESALERMTACVAALRDSVARTRMQPVERLFAALPRLVRDTATALGKTIVLQMEGSNVELDREMVEQLRDPLVHMVRNAIDHGIETVEARRSAGKPEIATITIEARQNGNQIAISVSDDGRGIDCGHIRNRAIELGLIDARAATALSDEAAADLIFLAGLSTADAVSAISGRGVGMDVVRANIEKLGGTISLKNRPGHGLTVELSAPLTLSIVSVLAIVSGGQMFALPLTAVDEVFASTNPAVAVQKLGDGSIARIRDETLPVISLAALMGGDASSAHYLVVVDCGNGHRWALAVDGIGDHQDVVIRPVAPVVAALGLFAGPALPDDGKPLLVLDILGLARLAHVENAAHPTPAVSNTSREEQIALVTFRALSGQVWAIPVPMVERIADMPRAAFTTIGDAVIVKDGTLIYAALCDGALPALAFVPLLRLANGSDRIGVIVSEALDLIRVPVSGVTKTAAGDFILVEDRAVPLLDTARLFNTCDPGASTLAQAQSIARRA